MYELMLDTANLEELTKGINDWPVVGVTSNPSILKREGDIDVYARLAAIKALCGNRRSLHVQVVSETTDDIVDEAHYILRPVNEPLHGHIPHKTWKKHILQKKLPAAYSFLLPDQNRHSRHGRCFQKSFLQQKVHPLSCRL